MWAFLLFAGIFSGWWGALVFAAPPAPSLMPSTTSKNSLMTSHDGQIHVGRTLPFAQATTRRYVGTRETDDRHRNGQTTRNDLEPYRYHQDELRTLSRRRSQHLGTLERPESSQNRLESVRNLYPNNDEELESQKSSKHLHDRLQRLMDKRQTVEKFPDTAELRSDNNENDQASLESISYTLRGHHDAEYSQGEGDPRNYLATNPQLENFMNYQVTPTSLNDIPFERDYLLAASNVQDIEDEYSDEIDSNSEGDIVPDTNEKHSRTITFENHNRVIGGGKIMLADIQDYHKKHQTDYDSPANPILLKEYHTAQDVPENTYDPSTRYDESKNHRESTAITLYPSVDEPDFAPIPHHSTLTPLDAWKSVLDQESALERPRITRSVKQRERKRTKADSPREQRRRGRNKDRRGQNWCPDLDVGNRAYLAPTVFEGKARSMSSMRNPGSNYAVTFEVKQVYKSQPGFQPLLKNDSVRLHFRDKASGKSTLCSTESNGQDNQSGVVRANIKRGKVYLVFVNRVGPRNFTILGEPAIRSKKNEQAVQAVIRPDYVRAVTLSDLKDAKVGLRARVKLVCRTRGSPPPSVHWLKDGVPLHPRRGLRIQHKRRRSKVVIASARAEDSGRYECVAESTSGHRAELAAQLLVLHVPGVTETTTASWPRNEQPCPIAGDFCMNGGTCLFFETVGEPACRCAEGFTGLRCETKDVISTGSVYNRHRAPFSCKLGLSTSYYC